MNTSTLFSLLKPLQQNTVYFGPQGFEVISHKDELQSAQQGFSLDANNQPLSASEKANWQDNWLVFARDTELGDPYFVDSNEQQLPVYTAFLNDNGWQIELVASSLQGFVQSLNLLFEAKQQKAPLFVPDNTCIDDQQLLTNLHSKLVTFTQAENFWRIFIEGYLGWLQEDE